MPIFEYSCRKCSFNFEMLVKASDEIHCPQCGDANVTKLFSAFAYKTSEHEGASSSNSSCGTCTSKNCAQCT